MVSHRPFRERGQLLLVSAIVLAMIILGLAVLLNAAITAEVRAPDDPSTDITEAERLGLDLERSIADLGAYLNAEGPWEAESDLRTTLDRNISLFNNITFEAVGDRRATLATISLNDSRISFGTLVADGDRDADLTLDGEGAVNHSIRVDRPNATEIRGLTLSLNASEVANETENATGVQLWGTDTDTCKLYSFVANTSGGVDLVEQDINCTADNTAINAGNVVDTCDGPFATVVIGPNAPNASSTCYADGFADVEPIDGDGYGLSIRNPAATSGGYQYLVGTRSFPGVVDGAPYDSYAVYDPDSTSHPYVAPLVWTIGVDITQQARASERYVTRGIDVYADPANAEVLENPW